MPPYWCHTDGFEYKNDSINGNMFVFLQLHLFVTGKEITSILT